jgi:putative endonuclease
MKPPSDATTGAHKKSLGAFGERVAGAHLQARGYRIVERNFRVYEAELDIIARHGDTLVFVEVRTRKGGAPGMAALSVNGRKAEQLRRAVNWYIERHPQVADDLMRIDVVTVELAADGSLRRVTHIEDAVRGDR